MKSVTDRQTDGVTDNVSTREACDSKNDEGSDKSETLKNMRSLTSQTQGKKHNL